MKTLILWAAVVLVSGSALGQATSLRVLTRANQLKNQNNASSTAAPQSKPAPPPKPDPVLALTVQTISSLQADLATIQSDPLRKQPLINDLETAPHGSHPTKNSIAQLTSDLASVLGGKRFSEEQLKSLAQNIYAICNSSHLTASRQQAVCEEARKILQGGGASTEEASRVVEDLKTIAAQTK